MAEKTKFKITVLETTRGITKTVRDEEVELEVHPIEEER